MPRVHAVKKARKNYPEYNIKRGDSYFWWKFRNSPRVMSQTAPSRGQLTRSDFLSWLYELEDILIPLMTTDDGMEIELDNYIAEIEEKREELESNLENMPEHLQETATSGMLLTERIDALDDWIINLNEIEFAFVAWESENDEALAAGDLDSIEYWLEKLEEIKSTSCEV